MKIQDLTRKKVLFFDLDGTVMDSMGMWDRLNRRLLEADRVPEPPDLIAALTPLNEYDTADYFRRLGCHGTTEEIMERIETMALVAYREEIDPKPGAYRFMKAMRERGISLAMITAALPSRTAACLSRHGMGDWFDMILNCDGYPAGKCSPEIFLDAMKKMRVEPADTLYFEDNLVALVNAKAAGMETVAVLDEIARPHWEEIRAAADYAIREFTEIEWDD